MAGKSTNILIVGAGEGGAALISVLRNIATVNITGVVDKDMNAPGIKLAKQLKIPVDTDWNKFLGHIPVDEAINVTGNPEVQKELMDSKPAGTELVSGHSAKLIWELLSETERIAEEFRKRAENIERLNRVTVGRELKMRELKERIRELEAKLKGKN